SLDQVEKDDATFPEWTPALSDTIASSTRDYVDAVVFGSDGTLAALLTTPHASAALDGAPVERVGVLSLPSFLARQARPDASSPVMRGRVLRERVLCQELPPAPDDVPMVLAAASTGVTTRARYETHVHDATCAGCHELMDPLGFAL